MKKTLLTLALLFSMLMANAGPVKLAIDPSPKMGGVLKFQPDGVYYFDMATINATKQFEVTNETGNVVGYATFNIDYFAGYSGYINQGAFNWPVFEPGTYTLNIPADSFMFTKDETTLGNKETSATVNVLSPTHITVKTSLGQEDVRYVSQLDGMEFTFEGASKVEVGNQASISFSNDDPDDWESCGACGSWSTAMGGKAEINGNKITIHGIEDWFTDEYPVKDLTFCVNPIPASMIAVGTRGFIFDGVDLDDNIYFHLSKEDTTGIGAPIYKLTISRDYDLQGRPADSNTKGIVIRDGKKVVVK